MEITPKELFIEGLSDLLASVKSADKTEYKLNTALSELKQAERKLETDETNNKLKAALTEITKLRGELAVAEKELDDLRTLKELVFKLSDPRTPQERENDEMDDDTIQTLNSVRPY